MAEQAWTTDEIEVTVSGLVAPKHTFRTAAATLGEFRIPSLTRLSHFRGADGRELVAERVSWWRGRFELREGDTLLAQGRLSMGFRRQIDLWFAGRTYMLQPPRFLTRSWIMFDEQGKALLEVRPRGFFQRGAVLTILAEIELALLSFAYYLVHQRWQSETASHTAAMG